MGNEPARLTIYCSACGCVYPDTCKNAGPCAVAVLTEREAVAHFEKPDKLARSQAEHVRAIRQSGKPAPFRVMFPKETNVTISDKWKALTRDTPTGFYMARSAVKWDSQPLHVVVIETVSGDKAAFPACAATHLFCPLALYEGPEGTGWRDDTIKALEAKLADAENTVKDDHERLTGRLATMQKERDDYRAKFKLALSECEREDNERKVALRERDEARYANECQRPGESDSDHARRMLRLAKEANHRDDMAALKAANLAAGRNVTDAMREAAAEACLDNASERLSTEATTIGWLTLAVAFILGAASLACAWLFVTGKVMP